MKDVNGTRSPCCCTNDSYNSYDDVTNVSITMTQYIKPTDINLKSSTPSVHVRTVCVHCMWCVLR